MAESFMNRYFSADAAAKASTVAAPAPVPRRGRSMDDAVAGDLVSGRKDSLVGFIFGHGDRMQMAEDLYRAGKDEEADKILRDEEDTINANRAGIHRIGMTRNGDNPEVNALYATARDMASFGFKSRKVRRAEDGDNGPEYTFGQLQSGRADDIKSAGIEGYGFGKTACDGYFGRHVDAMPERFSSEAEMNDFKDMVKECNRVFVDPELKLGSPAVASDLRQQRINGADFVNRNARRLYDTFGAKGACDFVRTVVSRSKGAGGMDKVMGGLLDMYEAGGGGVAGRDAADGFFDMIVSANGADMSDPDYRNAAMAALEAIKASGKVVDFSDSVSRSAFATGVSILARGYADGYNLLKLGDDRGKNVRKYLGEFIANVDETGEIPQNNPLSSMYSFHNRLMRTVTPDGTPIPDVEPTGNANAYKRPQATGAGNVAKGFVSALEREMAPLFMSGLSDREAFNKVWTDVKPGGAYGRVNSRVARDLGVDEGTAALLTAQMFSYLGTPGDSRGPVNVEGIMGDLSLKNPVARSWYNANVLDSKRYARREAEAMEHLTSPLGGSLNPSVAAARIAQLRIDADEALRRGEDPEDSVWNKELRTGVWLVPTGRYFQFKKTGKNGSIVTGKADGDKIPEGAVREFEYRRGNLDDAEFSYRGAKFAKGGYSLDRRDFARVQSQMADEMKRSDATLRAWGGRVSEDDAFDDGSYSGLE